MIERTEEQIEKERQMIASMKLAQANMTAALKRIERLEQHLTDAANYLSKVQAFIPECAYEYKSEKALRVLVKEWEMWARSGL